MCLTSYGKRMKSITDAHTAALETYGNTLQNELQEDYDKHCQNLITDEKTAYADTVAKLDPHTTAKLDELTKRANKAMD